MSSIDEKFKKVIAENAAPEEVKEDAATGDTAIKKGAVPPQPSPLSNSATEVGGSTKEKPEDLDLINLARLISRYKNFPGEIEIKNDIEKILKFWKITKNELFAATKIIWAKTFRPSNTNKDLVGSGFDTSY